MTSNPVSLMNFDWFVDKQIAGSRGPQSFDHIKFLRERGIRALVRMTEISWITTADVAKLGMIDFHEPVPDMKAPSITQTERMLEFVEKCIAEEKPVGVSCDGGIGRTGTLMACYLVKKGLNAEDAIQQLKKIRPCSVLTVEQKSGVEEFASYLRQQSIMEGMQHADR